MREEYMEFVGGCRLRCEELAMQQLAAVTSQHTQAWSGGDAAYGAGGPSAYPSPSPFLVLGLPFF